MSLALRKVPELFSSGTARGRVKIMTGKAGPMANTARRWWLEGRKFFNRIGNPITRFDLDDDQVVKIKTGGTLQIRADGK